MRTLASDLATLGRDNRRALPPVDVSLRALVQPAPLRALTALAHVFAGRVARAAAGATALAYAAFVLVVWWNPGETFGDPMDDRARWSLASFDDGDAIARLVVVVAVAYAIAARLADRAFDRALRHGDADERARRLVARADRPARVLAIIGATASVSTIAAGWFLFGHGYPWFPAWSVATIHATALHVAIALALVVVLAQARFARRLSSPFAIPLALAAIAATLTVAFATDPGNALTAFMQSKEPSEALRFALTVTGTLAVAALVGAVVERAQK